MMTDFKKLTDKLVKINLDITSTEAEISQQVGKLQHKLTDLRELDKKVRESIRSEMEKQGVSNFENEYLQLTYIKPSTRVMLNAKLLKEELPEVYNDFSKQVLVSSSVRIKIKE